MYKLNKAEALTPQMIVKYIETHLATERQLTKLKDYYRGKQDILKRSIGDTTKPNNRVVNPYPSYITDMFVGYFMGEPVAYTSEEDGFLARLTNLYDYNDESSENAELAKDASVCGVAYELIYLDEDKEIRFKKLEPETCIPIYDDTVEGELLYFIRYYTNKDIVSGEETTYVEVYTRNERILYKKALTAMVEIERAPHSFGLVPISTFANNEEQIGDFEPVISLIDAYDKLESDSVNDWEYFNDAYLALYGLSGTEAEDIAAMKEMRVLLMPTESKAEWLIKNANDNYIENLKARIDSDIHKFSKCPPMTDENFSANASGVAMRYKLMGLENATSKKERSFKKALQRRLEIICNMYNVMGATYDWRAINITFKRNIPANLTEMAEVVSMLGGLLSEETKIGLLPIDADYEAERAKKDREAMAGYAYGFERTEEDNELLGAQNN